MYLIKESVPGWIKEFSNKEHLRKTLLKYICHTCRKGEETGFEPDPYRIYDLLFTPCGLEFEVSEEDPREPYQYPD